MKKINRHCEKACPRLERGRQSIRNKPGPHGLLRCARNDDIVSNEAGSALVYILIAIALLAALTVAFMNPSSNQTASQNTFRAVSEIKSQVDFIRAAVQECVLRSSFGNAQVAGDATVDNTVTGTDPGANRLYPLAPNSGHLAAPVATDIKVKNLRCPSDPGDNPDHAPIFGGTSGKFMPPPPPLFGDWQWYNGRDGVFFWTETTNSDAYIDTVMEKLNADYATCEVDTIDATGGAEALDEAGTVTCANGAKCFRVWMIADTTRGAGAVEDGEADNEAAHFPSPDADETAAGCDVP
ncbi:MAG: hypothetical protein H6867_11380 [Rhodospirillales bacterium]|nr:hypothetical protein [Rhodospirillales bacterium]MCB9996731.1 hypothetical protein [Rhodospirillales bacterium]